VANELIRGNRHLLADLEEFVHDHRPHGTLIGDATEPAWNGYLLTVACPSAVVFGRWITPQEADADLFRLAGAELARTSDPPTCHDGHVRLACPRPIHRRQGEADAPGSEASEVQG
jgi:hypothetical protein